MGKSSDAYPEGEGVVLLNGVREGYLTFAGMVKITGEEISAGALRDGVDALAARGIVRRGLVLGCDLCDWPSFIAIGNLAQVNQCSRRGAANDLAQSRCEPVGVDRAVAALSAEERDLRVARDFGQPRFEHVLIGHALEHEQPVGSGRWGPSIAGVRCLDAVFAAVPVAAETGVIPVRGSAQSVSASSVQLVTWGWPAAWRSWLRGARS
jgi:hypothetical protein